MDERWVATLTRWTEAHLIDQQTAERIRAFEGERSRSTGLRWPVVLALACGALMLAAGVLLFVSAHWDTMSPAMRFSLVILLVAAFHLAGAGMAERFPLMATSLHAVGTIALGAGIFLAGQIFNLDEHWPGGLMLWALGATLALAILRDGPHLALSAILVPGWLISEWFVATTPANGGFDLRAALIVASGMFLLALTYFTASQNDRGGDGGFADDKSRRILLSVGGIALLPAALALTTASSPSLWRLEQSQSIPLVLRAIGWTVALGVPLTLSVALRRKAAWPNALAAVWVLALIMLRPLAADVFTYVWWALGAIALVAWGARDGRGERINMGAALFAATVLTFYFSQVMDKLGRSASLAGLGVLFLGGGWALERLRRRLVRQARGGEA